MTKKSRIYAGSGISQTPIHIKGERITVDAVQIIFLTGDQPAAFIKDRFPTILIVLEYEITLGFSVICVFTGNVFQDGHVRCHFSDRQSILQRGNENPLPFSKPYISFHKYPQSLAGLLFSFPGNGYRRC